MPDTLPTFWSSSLLASAGFTEEYFASQPGQPWISQFDSYYARCARYDVYWACYEGNVYRAIQGFNPDLKTQYDLYDSTRSIESPAYRLGEFWSEHLFGGQLDEDAGDGLTVPSAIPIDTDSPKETALREAIALLWKDSVWQANKDTLTRFGAVLGDVGLMVCDDPYRQRVYLKVIHPRIVRHVFRDDQGNCRGYVFEERRTDPRFEDQLLVPPLVRYTEVAERVGQRVQYQTFLDGELYDWRDYPDDLPESQRIGPEWTEDYGFVPFIWIMHRDMGVGAGWAEAHPSLSRMLEVDDLASKTDDQIRKSVDCVWFLTGVTKANLTITYGDDEDEGGETDVSRSRVPMITVADTNATAKPMVATVDIAAATARIDRILNSIEKNHEELQDDAGAVANNASGRARRIARERVEARVSARRAVYDHKLVDAHKMAISIAAQKGYAGYEAFTADSYDLGELNHTIGDRPVFAVDEMDRIEEATARAAGLSSLTGSDVPVEVAMEIMGYSPDLIAKVKRSRAEAQRAATEEQNRRMDAAAAALAEQDQATANAPDAGPDANPQDVAA